MPALCLGSAARATTSIRVLNAYQNASVGTTLGASHSQIASKMAEEIVKLNEALSASGANFTVELAGSVKATTLLGVTVTDALTKAYDDWSILAARDQVKADVTMVFVNFAPDYAGLTGGFPSAYLGMSVVNVTYLSRYAYQHEFGHLLGAQHQDAGGQAGNTPGGPSWAHGYYDLFHFTTPSAHDQCVHTIMAHPPLANWLGYNCGGNYNGKPNTSQRLIFSNINSPFSGDATHNNTYQMNLAAPTAATWHTTKLFKGPAVLGAVLNFLLLTQ